MSRFTLEIDSEPPQQFTTRRAALAYIRQRQHAGSLPAGAKLRDGQTGTVLRVPAQVAGT